MKHCRAMCWWKFKRKKKTKQQARKTSIRSFKPHVHLNDCYVWSPTFIFTNQLKWTFTFEELQQGFVAPPSKRFSFTRRSNCGNQSTVCHSVVFSKGYRSISQGALTIKETCSILSLVCQFYDHFPFLSSQRYVVCLYRL